MKQMIEMRNKKKSALPSYPSSPVLQDPTKPEELPKTYKINKKILKKKD